MKFRFIADDFTGASDVLLQCRNNGVNAAIVTDIQSDTQAESFDGIATTSRSMSPTELSENLPPMIDQHRDLGTDVLLYKVCSTFDSSREVGSIGHTVKLLRESIPNTGPITVVPAQPGFGRYTVFGHHFAASGDEIFRLDRHPIMRTHPTTPMRESDLRVLLSQQGIAPDRIAHIPITDLRTQPENLQDILTRGDEFDVVVVDAVEENDLDITARNIVAAQTSTGALTPVIGSGGIAGALARTYDTGRALRPSTITPGPSLVLSGSRSAMTREQIEVALSDGWSEIRLNRDDLLTHRLDAEATRDRVIDCLLTEQRVIVSIDEAGATGTDPSPVELAKASGVVFADLIRSAVKQAPNSRVAVLGGDTSSWTVSNLHPSRIEVAAPFVQAGPILNFQAPHVPAETPFLLKGGQVGQPDTLIKFAEL
ncbi:four-carbon acid sugar kinase family protein [Corynebacterium glyciniphilum]|uniref:four-carbon acid sugar kinase family protein n=1 Tax=Corynebacterium glyciniphilum TaxID=1404244 RepID=UPI003DA0C7EA